MSLGGESKDKCCGSITYVLCSECLPNIDLLYVRMMYIQTSATKCMKLACTYVRTYDHVLYAVYVLL